MLYLDSVLFVIKKKSCAFSGAVSSFYFLYIFCIDDCLYRALLCSLEQTHCARMWFYMSD